MEDAALRELIYSLLATGSLLNELEAASQIVVATAADEAAIVTALGDANVQRITLTNDIITLQHFVVNRATPIEIDFNGFKLASLATDCAIDLLAGELKLSGQGSIVASGQAAGVRVRGAVSADNTHYAKLTVGPAVTLYAPRSYGVQIVATGNAAYGITVELEGKIIAKDGIGIHPAVSGQGENLAHIYLRDGSKIEADATEGAGIYALGQGIWQLEQTEINAATDVVYKAGQMELNSARLTATGSIFEFIEHDLPPRLKLVAGEFVAQRALFAHLPEDAEIEVRGGTVKASDVKGLPEALPEDYHIDRNRRTGEITVVGPQYQMILDPVEQFKHEQAKLDALLAKAQEYLALIESGEGMGDWQDAVEKAATSIRRAVNSTKKLLSSDSVVLDQLLHAEKKLETAMRGIEQVEDDLRAEIFSVLAMAQELAPQDYSAYSYNILLDSMHAAEQMLTESGVTIDRLYSMLCDVNLNLDLLEEPEEAEAAFGLESDAEMGNGAEANAMTDVLSTAEAQSPLSMTETRPPLSSDGMQLPLPMAEMQPSLSIAEMQPPLLSIAGAQPQLPVLESQPVSPITDSMSSPIQPEWPAPVEFSPEEARTLADLGAAVLLTSLLQTTDLEETVDAEAERAFTEAVASLQAMLEAVQDLRLSDYREEFVEQFGELQVAIANARAVLVKPDVTLSTILDTMDAVKFATAGLRVEPQASVAPSAEPEGPEVAEAVPEASMPIAGPDWTEIREIVQHISGLEASDYTAESYNRVVLALERAKPLLADNFASQTEINDLVFDLNLAVIALERQTQAPVSQQFQTQNDTDAVQAIGATVINQVSQVVQATNNDMTATESEPNLFASIAAGVSSGFTAYRRSRLATKRRKLLRKAQALMKTI